MKWIKNSGFYRTFIGAEARNRTADLLITNQLLYQLSYLGSKGPEPIIGERGQALNVHIR